jgi:hypothetical protein
MHPFENVYLLSFSLVDNIFYLNSQYVFKCVSEIFEDWLDTCGISYRILEIFMLTNFKKTCIYSKGI